MKTFGSVPIVTSDSRQCSIVMHVIAANADGQLYAALRSWTVIWPSATTCIRGDGCCLSFTACWSEGLPLRPCVASAWAALFTYCRVDVRFCTSQVSTGFNQSDLNVQTTAYCAPGSGNGSDAFIASHGTTNGTCFHCSLSVLLLKWCAPRAAAA
jgi:hypothetical protein